MDRPQVTGGLSICRKSNFTFDYQSGAAAQPADDFRPFAINPANGFAGPRGAFQCCRYCSNNGSLRSRQRLVMDLEFADHFEALCLKHETFLQKVWSMSFFGFVGNPVQIIVSAVLLVRGLPYHNSVAI